MRPSSRSALASWLSFGDAESFFSIVDGTTDRVRQLAIAVAAEDGERFDHSSSFLVLFVGAVGFEPTNAGTKTP